MNGIVAYENKYERLINNKILSNADMPFLRPYVNSLASKSLSTIYAYLGHVVNFVKETNKSVEQINYDDYVTFIASKRKMTASYQIAVYAALASLSKYLFVSDRCQKDYAAGIEAPKFVEKIETAKKRDIGFLSEKEIATYINNVKRSIGTSHSAGWRKEWMERDLAIILILLTTGMRCSALYKLDVNSIDFENNIITTIDKERKIQEHPVTDEVIECVNDWLKKRSQYVKSSDENALFLNRFGDRISTNGIKDIVTKYSINIKGKHITPHKLRATYGTQIYSKTHDLYMVQQCMGHSSPRTSELYIRGQKKHGKDKAADIMNKLIF